MVLLASLFLSLICSSVQASKVTFKSKNHASLAFIEEKKAVESVKEALGISGITRSGKVSAAIALTGLSNTLTQFANALGATTDQEKQQAVLSALGAITGTAGLLMLQSEIDKKKRTPELVKKFKSETYALTKTVIEAGAACGKNLEVIKQLSRAEDQESVVTILCSDVTTAQNLLIELLQAVMDVVQNQTPFCLDQTADQAKEAISNLLLNDINEENTLPEGNFVVFGYKTLDELEDATEKITVEIINNTVSDIIYDIAQEITA